MTFAFAVGWAETTVVFNETFDRCSGTGGNDDSWSGSVASSTLTADNTDWTFVSGYGADKCAKFGAGSVQGSATTPALTALDGNATLTFKAGAWKGDQPTLNLEISGGGSLSKSSVTMVNEQWTEYTIQITGGTATTKITFKGKQASKARFFLDEVKITQETGQTLSAPTISVSNGPFYTGDHAKVTLSHSDADASILYSLDGSDPSITYTAPLDITATTTVKAKAVKGELTSSVAEETITFGTGISTLAEYNNNNQVNTNATFKYNGNAVVTYYNTKQSGNNTNSYLWIKDDTGYALIYNSNAAFAQGTQLKPGWTGTKGTTAWNPSIPGC